jgi:uncharacterized protein (TIGR02444 family)
LKLWEFALSVYGRPGFEAACLALQDEHGQCVPFLLWRLWAVAEGRGIDPVLLAGAAETARAWEDAATVPLRDIRRRLKRRFPPVSDSARAALREDLKAAELNAERLLLETLEALTPPPSAAGFGAAEALAEATAAWGAPLNGEVLADLIATSG